MITLTDRDGIFFNLSTQLIEEIHGVPSGTELVLNTGEKVYCKEHVLRVLQMISAVKFGGAR